QSLPNNFSPLTKDSRCTGSMTFRARDHRLVPTLRKIKTEVDVLKVLSRRSGKDPFRFGIVAVEYRHPGAERRLPAGKLHIRIFRQNLAERSCVAGPVQHGCGAPEPDDWRLFASGKHIVIDVDRFSKPALEQVGVGQKIIGIRISRIEREGGGEVTLGFVKMVAAAIDVAGEK